ncbi:hypothetical protein BKE30_14460 [Alkanindiges hydrocarboniclasticus]|uniref:DUF4942 domain-containing protein n=1 Tax=Alkanindiges hydrocarboniclasticus TaxID=1907941 RepID=A0A1S8CR28_9GAMM|nr:class I SAM-dependent methyltransferase [Alkanindiges hydrocarboniclasticus]ONG37413.1 hypothetical protein BKE30_14460 [Alkanindiges hydrocarboniclasticus]
MNALVKVSNGLTDQNYLNNKLADFNRHALMIEQACSSVSGCWHYLLKSAGKNNYGTFNQSNALGILSAEYWASVFKENNLYEILPINIKNDWINRIGDYNCPEFNRENVAEVIKGLYLNFDIYLLDRVENVFKGLSGAHVTNSPMGFNKRMIFSGNRSEHIDELRKILQQLNGKSAKIHPMHMILSDLFPYLGGHNNYGVWHTIDAGVIRFKKFKNGNVHLEVNPEIAWRLNELLAKRYPMALPESVRRKPVKVDKTFELRECSISMEVAKLLSFRDIRAYQNDGHIPKREYLEGMTHCLCLGSHGINQLTADQRAELDTVIEALEGTRMNTTAFFPYSPAQALLHIQHNRRLPDQKSYQFYPTQQAMVEEMQQFMNIEPHHTVLEPEAGTGSIAISFPQECPATLVEISSLRCKILEEKKYPKQKVVCADFIAWAKTTGERFDRIMMNPPFSEGRAELHVKTAAGLLAKEGELVAIVPASLINKTLVDGFKHTYSRVYQNAFLDTGVNVVILHLKHN